jgi:hypothetical protein
MKTPYVCCTKPLEEYYLRQTGDGLPYYSGAPLQRGYGLGGIFGSIFRTIFPFLKQGAKTVGKELMKTGVSIASDVVSGENVKTAAKRRFQETGRTLVDKAVEKTKSMIGEGRRRKLAGIYKRKHKTRKRIILAKVPDEITPDIFVP